MNGVTLGQLAATPSPSAVPLMAGGYGTLAGEEDNSVFALTPQMLADLAASTTFTVSFSRASGGVVLDGINIQATTITAVSEPGSLALLALGLVFGFARRFNAR